MRIAQLALLTLMGCTGSQAWTLIADLPEGKLFVQQSSIREDSGVVTAQLRSEFPQPRTTEAFDREHSAVHQVVRIRCSEGSWTTMTYVAFDQGNNVLKEAAYPGTQFYVIPRNASIYKVTTSICEHALRGAPLAVQSSG